MTSNQDPIATSNLYPMAMVPTPLTEALNMHPLAQLVLEYVGDLGLWIQYPCHHDQTNVKIYQQHFANSVNQKLDELIKMVELVKSKINEKQLVSCDFVQWACPISPLCATGHGLDSIDISNVQYYDFNELAKIEDLNKKWHEVQRLQAIVYLILSQYVEQIRKSEWNKEFSDETLAIADEFGKWTNTGPKQFLAKLKSREKFAPPLNSHSIYAIFSLVNIKLPAWGRNENNLIKDISSKELSEAIKVLAEFCKTPKEKGLFLLKLITYWDRYMDLVEYDTYVVPPMFPCRFWPCYSSRSLMLERARKCLINWKRDENAILDTVDDRGRSLLEVAIEHYEDPLKFSEKAASYDYDKEDLLGKKLIRYKRIRDIDECLIS